MIFHICQNALHFHVGSPRTGNENDIVACNALTLYLGKSRSYNSPCAVALNRAAYFLAAGYTDSRFFKSVSHCVSNETRGRLALSAIVDTAKILVFL